MFQIEQVLSEAFAFAQEERSGSADAGALEANVAPLVRGLSVPLQEFGSRKPSIGTLRELEIPCIIRYIFALKTCLYPLWGLGRIPELRHTLHSVPE